MAIVVVCGQTPDVPVVALTSLRFPLFAPAGSARQLVTCLWRRRDWG